MIAGRTGRRTNTKTAERPRGAVFPSGWYQVGFSDELPPGQLKQVRFFGRTLVLFRTTSGRIAMLTGICGHNAYPLARGVVKGECIECPVHQWLWGVDGTVTKIPYAFSGGHGLRIKSWSPRELGGLIVVWYPDDGQPDGPEPSELATDRPAHFLTAPEAMSNVDTAHGSLLMRELQRNDGPLARVWASAGSSAELEARSWGSGLHQVRLQAGPVEVIELAAATPISREKVQRFSRVSVKTAPHGEESARAIVTALSSHWN